MMEVVGGRLYEGGIPSRADVQRTVNRATIAEALGQDSTQLGPTPYVDTITAGTREAVVVPLTIASLPDGRSEVTNVVEVTTQEIATCKAKMDDILFGSRYDALSEPHRLTAIMSAFHRVAPQMMKLAGDNSVAGKSIESAMTKDNTGIISLKDLNQEGGNSCASMTALSSGVLALYGYEVSPIAGSMTGEGGHAYFLAKNGPHCFLCDPNNPLNKGTDREEPAIENITPAEYEAHRSDKNHTLQADFGSGDKVGFENNLKMAA